MRSRYATAFESSKIGAAVSNEIPCFRRLLRFFLSSHTKTMCIYKTVALHGWPAWRPMRFGRPLSGATCPVSDGKRPSRRKWQRANEGPDAGDYSLRTRRAAASLGRFSRRRWKCSSSASPAANRRCGFACAYWAGPRDPERPQASTPPVSMGNRAARAPLARAILGATGAS
jgi:hypothetical protein